MQGVLNNICRLYHGNAKEFPKLRDTCDTTYLGLRKSKPYLPGEHLYK